MELGKTWLVAFSVVASVTPRTHHNTLFMGISQAVAAGWSYFPL